MPEKNETHVVYKAIADFTALGRALRKARSEVSALQRAEAKLNAQSVAGSMAATIATGKHAKSRDELIDAFEKEAATVKSSTVRFIENSKSIRENSKSVQNHSESVNRMTGEINGATASSKKLGDGITATMQSFRKVNGVWKETAESLRRNGVETNKLNRSFSGMVGGIDRVHRGLDKLDDWRPRLIPPFIALIPAIGAVLALINPLVAGLGAVGAAGIGFASSLGRVAAGAIGAVPAIATLLSMIVALKTAFGGIGGAFKAFTAMKKATGGGGGGAPAKAELTQAEQITRAQEAYARSIQDVQFAQDDLDDARKGYIQRLRELQKAVDRAAMSEARAAANSQLARENYANILADPGSTKGDKMLGKVGVDEAKTELQDVQDQNKQNADELAQMRKDGIEGDRQVVMAMRHVTDAINAQRDAQLALINAQNGSNKAAGGAASAADLYAQALAKLSPSARRFVEEIIGMKDAWDAVKRATQESFFSKFVGDIQLLRQILPSVQSLLSDTAGAVGQVVDRLLKLITSPKWQQDLILIGKQNVPIINNIGDALLSWVDAFKDLTIIAGPFLTELTDGLAEGAKNFQELIASARADGSLASYLEDVRQRMSQWWRIVKNIGKALFNFSAAAGDFATWITDGFERVTQGWLKSSEDARKAGSPFQQYLEDVKPLVTQVRGLFADFFKWFAKTAGDPKNISAFVDILKTIRTELGPAIAKLLQTLSDSGIGQKLVESLTSIIESLASIIDSGGGAGFAAFFDIVTAFFRDLAAALKNPILGPVIKTLAVALGTIAALSFVGKFTGLTAMIGWLIKLARTQGIFRLLDKLPFIGAGGSGGAHAATAGGRVAGAARGVAGAARSGVSSAVGFLGGLGSKVKPAAAAKVGKGFNLLGSIAKGAGRGAGIGAALSIIGTVGGDLISSSAASGKKGAGQRVGGNALAGAASGAGIGALAGSIVPGVGTAIGAAVGGVIGGGVGLATSSDEDKAAFFEGIGKGWNDFWGTAVPKFWEDLSSGFSDWITGLGQVWNDFWGKTWPDFWQGLADGWNNFITVDVPNFIGTLAADIENFFTVTLPQAWNTFWGTTWPQFWQTLGDGWTTFFTVTLPGLWNTFWGTTWPTFWKTLGDGWNTFFTVTLPNAWNGFWGTTWPNFWKTLADGWNNFFGVTLPNAWNGFWGRTWPNFWKGLADGWNNFFAVTLPNAWNGYWGKTFPQFWSDFAAGIGGFFGDIGRNWNNFWGGIFGNVSSAYEDRKTQLNGKKAPGRRNGGVIYRAGGGGVPGSGNSDTKAAMLTPGEFVLRKAIVGRVGIDNLVKFNAGVMSYAELLQRAMANQPAGSKDDKKGVGFFDGGGLVNDFSFGNSGGGSGGGSDFPPGFGGGGSGDGGIHIENLVVNNPSPEPTSDSLPRSIRKVAYLGSRGGRG